MLSGPYEKTIEMITNPHSDRAKVYKAIRGLFNLTKKLYGNSPFLSASEAGLQEADCRKIFRLTNLATFVASVFGAQDVGFCELNDHFLDAFGSEDEHLTTEIGRIFLDFKTQVFISAMSTRHAGMIAQATLDHLFPECSPDRVHAAGGYVLLTEDFLRASRARKGYLMMAVYNLGLSSTISLCCLTNLTRIRPTCGRVSMGSFFTESQCLPRYLWSFARAFYGEALDSDMLARQH